MLRRPPTSIGITAEDIALFESQYAQGHIYRSHHYQESDQANSNGQNSSTRGQRYDPNMPATSGGDDDNDAASMEANPGGEAEAPVGQTHASSSGNRNSGQRRIKTREQRIQGSVVAAAAAAASGSAAAAAAASAYTVAGGVVAGGVAGAGDGSGGATRVAVGPAQQQYHNPYMNQYQQR